MRYSMPSVISEVKESLLCSKYMILLINLKYMIQQYLLKPGLSWMPAPLPIRCSKPFSRLLPAMKSGAGSVA